MATHKTLTAAPERQKDANIPAPENREFTNFPQELRDDIYEHLFQQQDACWLKREIFNDRPVISVCGVADDRTKLPFRASTMSLNLNRQIRNEAALCFFRMSTIVIRGSRDMRLLRH